MSFKTMKTAFSLVLLLFFLAYPVVAQQSFDLQNYLGSGFNPDALAQFLFPGLPPEFLRIPQIIWYVIVPFIAVFTVIYGFLQELRLFRYTSNKVNIVLAFSLALLLLPSGALTFIVVQLYSFGAAFAAIIFGIVFIVGVFMWMIASGYRFWGTVSIESTYNKAISNINKDIHRYRRERQKIFNQLTQARDPGQRESLTKTMDAIDQELYRLENRLHDVKTAARS